MRRQQTSSSPTQLLPLISHQLKGAREKHHTASQRQKKSREGPSLDWLKTSSQSARSGVRAVCSSLKFSLTRNLSSSSQDLFIGSLMLTRRVFYVRNEFAHRWKSSPFFPFPFSFLPVLMSICEADKKTGRIFSQTNKLPLQRSMDIWVRGPAS